MFNRSFQFSVRHAVFNLLHFCRQFCLLGFFHALFRHQRKQNLMRVVQQVIFNQLLVIIAINAFAQLCQHFVVTQPCQRVAVIQPSIHHADAVNQPFRVCAKIGLAQFKLQHVQAGFQKLFINAFNRQLLQSAVHNAQKFVALVRLAAAYLNRQHRLAQAAGVLAVSIGANAAFKQRQTQRRTVALQKHCFQKAQRKACLSVARIAANNVKFVVGFSR